MDPESVAIEQIWNDAWEQQLLSRAIEQIRADMGHTHTFAAFEMTVIQDESAANRRRQTRPSHQERLSREGSDHAAPAVATQCAARRRMILR